MNEFIANVLLGVSNESENRISKIAVKVLYYFNCVIITIWITDELGIGFTEFSTISSSIIETLVSLYIVVPVFTFLFVAITSRMFATLAVLMISFVVQFITYFAYYGKKSIELYLINERVFDENLKRGDNFDSYFRNLKRRRKIMKENSVYINYYAMLAATLYFIYCQIIQDKFHELYFRWLDISLIIWVILIFLLFGIMECVKNEIDKTVKKLKKLELISDGDLSS